MVKKTSKSIVLKIVSGALAVGFTGASVLAGVGYYENKDLNNEVVDLQSQINISQLNIEELNSLVSEQDLVIENKSMEIVNLKNTTPEIITEEVIVYVDNEDLAFVLERLEDKMIIEDAGVIVEELRAEDEAIVNVISFLKGNDEVLKAMEDQGLIENDKKVKLLKVYDSYDDLEILESDYESGTYEFKVMFRYFDEVAEQSLNVEVVGGIDYDGDFYFLTVE